MSIESAAVLSPAIDNACLIDGYKVRVRERLTESFLISKSWTLIPPFLAIRLRRKVVGALLVYRWLALVLITTPWFIRGA
jgi:hypothetical protein